MTRLSSLQSINLHKCAGLSAFLGVLAEEFDGCRQPSLSRLYISKFGTSGPWNDQLNAVFKSTQGLQILNITSSHPEYPDVDLICRHGQSLCVLHVDVFNHWSDHEDVVGHRYSIDELESLVYGCPHIEELGLDLADFDLVSLIADQNFYIQPHPKRTSVGKSVASLLVGIPLSQ